MRTNERAELEYPEPGRREATASVYDFGAKQTENSRLHRIKAIEDENALLTRMLGEIGGEIERLRKLLAGS